MVLNVWSAKWNGRRIEVRNHCFVAELLVDGEIVDRAPGLFRHDLRGTINGPKSGAAARPCSGADCAHLNTPGALFCANCGSKLPDAAATHQASASVEADFPPPKINCQISVDGKEVFKGA